MECPDGAALLYLLAGDVQVVFKKHKEVQQVERSHHGSAVPTKAPLCFELDMSELEQLENRVYTDDAQQCELNGGAVVAAAQWFGPWLGRPLGLAYGGPKKLCWRKRQDR